MRRDSGFGKLWILGLETQWKLALFSLGTEELGILFPVPLSVFSSVWETLLSPAPFTGLSVLGQMYRTGDTDGYRAILAFRLLHVEGLFLMSLIKVELSRDQRQTQRVTPVISVAHPPTVRILPFSL